MVSAMNTELELHKPTGTLYRPGNDLAIIYEQGGWKTMDVRHTDVVLDIGAHIGAFAVWVLGRGAASVVSVEPDVDNVRVLKANARGRNVKVVRAAVVRNNVKHVTFYLAKTACMHSTVNIKGRAAVQVPAVSFKRLLAAVKPTLLKIDIEGGEYELAEEIARLPKRIHTVGMEIHLWRKGFQPQAAQLVASLEAQGFVANKPLDYANTRGDVIVWNRKRTTQVAKIDRNINVGDTFEHVDGNKTYTLSVLEKDGATVYKVGMPKGVAVHKDAKPIDGKFTFRSVSAAAGAVVGAVNVNGWKFWGIDPEEAPAKGEGKAAAPKAKGTAKAAPKAKVAAAAPVKAKGKAKAKPAAQLELEEDDEDEEEMDFEEDEDEEDE